MEVHQIRHQEQQKLLKDFNKSIASYHRVVPLKEY